ncbi:MAG: DegT/DnrJ/EryC1/StrS family aminotransferase, partial [Gammaproteobacteria bacterium]
IWCRYSVEFAAYSAAVAIDLLSKRGVTAAKPVNDWRTGVTDDCPIAGCAFHRVVSLPLHPTLTGDEQETVIDAVRQIATGAP